MSDWNNQQQGSNQHRPGRPLAASGRGARGGMQTRQGIRSPGPTLAAWLTLLVTFVVAALTGPALLSTLAQGVLAWSPIHVVALAIGGLATMWLLLVGIRNLGGQAALWLLAAAFFFVLLSLRPGDRLVREPLMAEDQESTRPVVTTNVLGSRLDEAQILVDDFEGNVEAMREAWVIEGASAARATLTGQPNLIEDDDELWEDIGRLRLQRVMLHEALETPAWDSGERVRYPIRAAAVATTKQATRRVSTKGAAAKPAATKAPMTAKQAAVQARQAAVQTRQAAVRTKKATVRSASLSFSPHSTGAISDWGVRNTAWVVRNGGEGDWSFGQRCKCSTSALYRGVLISEQGVAELTRWLTRVVELDPDDNEMAVLRGPLSRLAGEDRVALLNREWVQDDPRIGELLERFRARFPLEDALQCDAISRVILVPPTSAGYQDEAAEDRARLRGVDLVAQLRAADIDVIEVADAREGCMRSDMGRVPAVWLQTHRSGKAPKDGLLPVRLANAAGELLVEADAPATTAAAGGSPTQSPVGQAGQPETMEAMQARLAREVDALDANAKPHETATQAIVTKASTDAGVAACPGCWDRLHALTPSFCSSVFQVPDAIARDAWISVDALVTKANTCR